MMIYYIFLITNIFSSNTQINVLISKHFLLRKKYVYLCARKIIQEALKYVTQVSKGHNIRNGVKILLVKKNKR